MSIKNLYGDIFAEVYSLFWTDFIDNIAPQLLEIINERISNIPIAVLDLCCGTGRLSGKLLEAGHEVVGVDLSESMIKVAERRNEDFINNNQAKFIVDDARSFKTRQTYDLVVSTFDSMNHLNSLNELSSCFKRVYSELNSGGYFIFDMNTEHGLKKWEFVDLDQSDDAVFIIHGIYERKDKKAYSKVFGFYRKSENCWTKFEEVMTNQVFSMQNVRKLLEEIGFEFVAFTEEENLSNTLSEPELEERVFLIAKK